MKALFPAAASTAPSFGWRLVTLLGLWCLIFGVVIAMTPPPPMEAGYDAFQEQLKGILCSPVLGLMGLTFLLNGRLPSLLAVIVALGIIFGPAALMLFRGRTKRAFWIWIGVQAIIITVSSIGFTHLARHWGQNP